MSHQPPNRLEDVVLTRRELLCRSGTGFGALALGHACRDRLARLRRPPARHADQVAQSIRGRDSINPLFPRAPPLTAQAKRVVHLFMNGGPSHVDTFDPKPMLVKHHGKPVPTQPAHRAEDGRCVPVAVQVPQVRPERHRGQRDLRHTPPR